MDVETNENVTTTEIKEVKGMKKKSIVGKAVGILAIAVLSFAAGRFTSDKPEKESDDDWDEEDEFIDVDNDSQDEKSEEETVEE